MQIDRSLFLQKKYVILAKMFVEHISWSIYARFCCVLFLSFSRCNIVLPNSVSDRFISYKNKVLVCAAIDFM